MTHDWPKDPAQHKWGSWESKTGMPKPTQYRKCIDPDCKAVEERVAPIAPTGV